MTVIDQLLVKWYVTDVLRQQPTLQLHQSYVRAINNMISQSVFSVVASSINRAARHELSVFRVLLPDPNYIPLSERNVQYHS